MKIIATKEPQNLVYIDESGYRTYGYCQKGQRFYALKSGKKTQRVSMIAALNGRKIVIPLTFEGQCNMDIFNKWFEQFLTPILEPGQTLIMLLLISLIRLLNSLKELVQKFYICLRIPQISIKLSIIGLL